MDIYTYEIDPPKNIKDDLVLELAPANVLERLGKQVGTGYDLINSVRDIKFENGVLLYNPYRSTVTVKFDITDT